MTPQERIEIYEKSSGNIQKLYSSPKTTELNLKLKTQHSFNNTQYDSFLDAIGDTILGFHHTKDLPQLLQKEVDLSADQAQRVVADLAEFLTPVLEREAEQANVKKNELQELGNTIGARENVAALLDTEPGEVSELAAEEDSGVETGGDGEGVGSEPTADGVPVSIPTMNTLEATTNSSTATDAEPTDPPALDEVQPMRTMRGDMQRIHGYGAYRDAHPDTEQHDEEPIVRSQQAEVLQEKPKLADTPRLGE